MAMFNPLDIDYESKFISVRHLVLECLTFLKKYNDQLEVVNNIKRYIKQATPLYDNLYLIHPRRTKNETKLLYILQQYNKLKLEIKENIYPLNLYIRFKTNNIKINKILA